MRNAEEYSPISRMAKSLPVVIVSAVLILYLIILLYYKP
jgi:hypothetical protein